MNSDLTFHLLVFEACHPFSPHLQWTGGEGEVSSSCSNLHKATHFLISSTTFIPSGGTSITHTTAYNVPDDPHSVQLGNATTMAAVSDDNLHDQSVLSSFHSYKGWSLDV